MNTAHALKPHPSSLDSSSYKRPVILRLATGVAPVGQTHLRRHALLIVLIETQGVLEELPLHGGDPLSACLLSVAVSGEAGLLFRGPSPGPNPGSTAEEHRPHPPAGPHPTAGPQPPDGLFLCVLSFPSLSLHCVVQETPSTDVQGGLTVPGRLQVLDLQPLLVPEDQSLVTLMLAHRNTINNNVLKCAVFRLSENKVSISPLSERRPLSCCDMIGLLARRRDIRLWNMYFTMSQEDRNMCVCSWRLRNRHE